MSGFISDTYATRLYAACEGFPLWNPSVLTLGDIGYIRQGTFHSLYNAERGPSFDPATSFSEEVRMARRTSGPSLYPHSDPSTPVVVASDLPNSSPQRPEMPGRRRSSIGRLLSQFPSNHANHGLGGSAMFERPPTPMPLSVEREEPRVFDMGPRLSTNYRNLGFSLGGHMAATTGLPVGATMSFETTGGTGALLLAKDPIHRYLLRNRGVLKAYFLAHRDFIYATYGQSEDVDIDDMVLVYGQDCTSDWACAVTLEAERGAKVEFEVFSFLETGVWGEWKTACSASQRGPHRYQSTGVDINRNADQSVVIKRLTIQSRRFLPMRLRAAAEPRPDGRNREDPQADLQGGEGFASEQCDPLDLVHDYLHDQSKAPLSMASDDDALNLLRSIEKWDDYADLKSRLWKAAKEKTSIVEDRDGVAMLQFTDGRRRKCSKEHNHLFTPSNSSSDISAY